jgi:hypothetical protein
MIDKWCINCDVLISDELVGELAIIARSDNPDFCSKQCELAYTKSADSELLSNSGASSIVVSDKSQAQIVPDGKTFSTLIDAEGNLKKGTSD